MKKAPLKVPTEAKKAPTKVPTKQGWRAVWWGILLAAWVGVVVIASQFVVSGVIKLALMPFVGDPEHYKALSSANGTLIINVIFYILSYVTEVGLLIWATPKIVKKWQATRKAKRGANLTTTREELGLKGYLTWTDIGLSVVGFVVATVLAAAVTAIFKLFPGFDAEEAQQTGFSLYMMGWQRVVGFLVLAVAAPVVEEVIFRGWLYGKLRSRLSMVPAILIVSVLFGVVHGQWNVAVDVFALSVVLCVLREITGTIYAGILVHMINNGLAFYVLYVLGI